jgi:hypothetical protein
MPRRLLVVNAVLALSAVGLALAVARELARPANRPAPAPRAAPAPPPAPSAAGSGTQAPAASAWAVIAARNLFSPSRSETPVSASPGSAPNLPRPHLYGVVVHERGAVAYLEDPLTRRVSAYRVGDTVAGATVESIAPDQVVLARADGQLRVRLHDPTKPRAPVPGPAAAGAAPAATTPSAPVAGPTPLPVPTPIPGALPAPSGVPGTPSPFVPPVPIVPPGTPGAPATLSEPAPTRGPVPLGPLRRLPPGLPSPVPSGDAPRP